MDAELSVLVRAGTMGALSLCILCTPLDVARHSLQAAVTTRKAAPSFREAMRVAAQPGIIRGLWRGLPLSAGLAALSPLAFLTVYEQQKCHRKALAAGAVARAAQTTLLQPLEFLRTCQQAGAFLDSAGRAHLERTLWDIMMSDGLKSLWRGLLPTLLRDVPASVVFWGSYCDLHTRVLLPLAQQNVAASSFAGDNEWPEPSSRIMAGVSVALGAASAVIAAIATQPLDVVKTKMQTHQILSSHKAGYVRAANAGFFATLRLVRKPAGVAGLWAGGLPRALRAAAAGVLLGPLCEFAQHVADDRDRVIRQPLVLPKDPTLIIVNPRSYKAVHIDTERRR